MRDITPIRDITSLDRTDVPLAGGKGASLGDMARAGFPVPPGFVILGPAYDRFVSEVGIAPRIRAILRDVDVRNMEDVARHSGEIRSLFMSAPMPGDMRSDIAARMGELRAPFVAVRSSAVSEDSAHSTWAGQFESYLNTTEETLEENIKRCWASLFTPQAIFYGRQMADDGRWTMAVIVQRMVASEVSGVAFSVHPVTQSQNTLIIEAVLGLGEALVGGHITPDSYVLTKKPLRIVSKEPGYQERLLLSGSGGGWQDVPESRREEQKLPDNLIVQLAELVIRVEEHSGTPVDIEWAAAGGEIYLLQSRPITTLTAPTMDKC